MEPVTKLAVDWKIDRRSDVHYVLREHRGIGWLTIAELERACDGVWYLSWGGRYDRTVESMGLTFNVERLLDEMWNRRSDFNRDSAHHMFCGCETCQDERGE